MVFGIFSGLAAAFLNSAGYLFSAFFLKRCNSPVRLLIFAQIWMMLLSIPLLLLLYPAAGVSRSGRLFSTLIVWIIVFFMGQGSFFMSLRFFEASRLSSLLGLKIIVLTAIYTVVNRAFPNLGQYLAILMAAAAAVTINWSGGGGSLKSKGWIFVFITLICYSLADITETIMVLCFVESGMGPVRSAFTSTALSYTALGLVSLPGLFFVRPDRHFLLSAPYALIWLLSQAALLTCFSQVLPVFGNVILASRGMFSVLLGALVSAVGLGAIEARISRAQWVRRGLAAFLMVLAIAVYSFATQK
ncbi:MAG: hypothetical protein IJS01_10890 [Lentisphaeria bacterium]|nr:hypothetical protein [Lentisphaeria bacterium]